MTRDAKLFFLTDKDWIPLKEIIFDHNSHDIKNAIAIFQVIPETSYQHYAIVSVSDEVDKIVEEYGAIAASEKDYIIPILKETNQDPLFGNKSLTIFLNWQY